jgi:hypothetical protein
MPMDSITSREGEIAKFAKSADRVAALQKHLKEIVQGRAFRGSLRSAQLLTYIVQQAVAGNFESLKERVIGAELFQRSPSYDTGEDAIVRVTASDVRKRLLQHYDRYGAASDIRISLPLGSYIPEIVWDHAIEADPHDSIIRHIGHLDSPATHPVSTSKSAAAFPETLPIFQQCRQIPLGLLIGGLILIVLGFSCAALFWSKYNTLQRSVYAWQEKPSLAGLWSEFLNASPDTDLVISDPAIGMLQSLSKKSFTSRDYFSRAYVAQLQSADLSPDMHTALNLLLNSNLGNTDEFTLARRIVALDPFGNKIHLYNAHNYMPDLIHKDNVILIGAQRSNPWDDLFESRINFFIQPENNGLIINRSPVSGEQQTYTHTDSVDYCVVAYFPNPGRNGSVLLIEGTRSEALEGAGNFLLSEDQLSTFKRMLHVGKLPYFEVLLKVSSVSGVPVVTTIEAYRTNSNIH